MLAKIKLHCGTLLGSRCVRQRTLTTLAVALILLPFAAKAQTASAQSIPVLPSGTASSGIVLDTPRNVLEVSVSRQPSQTFTAVLGAFLKGVSGYSATACDTSGTASLLSGGRVKNLVVRNGIPIIDTQLSAATANSARHKHPLYQVANGLEQASWTGGIAAAAFKITNPYVYLAISLISQYSHKAAAQFEGQYPDPAATYGKIFLTDEPIQVPANGCVSRIFLGGYNSQVSGFTSTLEVRASQ